MNISIKDSSSPEWLKTTILTHASKNHVAIFEIEHSLITLNEYVNIERSNRFKAAKIKEKIQKEVQLLLRNQAVKINEKCDFIFIWERVDNRHDSDNVFFAKKIVFDAMVSMGIMKGDGRKYVGNCYDMIMTTGLNKVTVYATK